MKHPIFSCNIRAKKNGIALRGKTLTGQKVWSMGSRFILLFLFSTSTFGLNTPHLPDSVASAERRQTAIALVYPDTTQTDHPIFQNIINGIKKPLGENLVERRVDAEETAESLLQLLRTHQVNTVIAIGQSTINMFEPQLADNTVIGIAIIDLPSRHTTAVTIHSDPLQQAELLKTLKADIEKVHFVGDATNNRWILDRAQQLWSSAGLELVIHDAQSLRETAKQYKNLQDNLDANREVIWLPLAPPGKDKALKQSVLSLAWKKRQLVFSSNFYDVSMGALFAFYPDDVNLGTQIYLRVQERIDNPSAPSKTVFTTKLNKALNRRSAENLDIQLTDSQRQSFTYVYPKP